MIKLIAPRDPDLVRMDYLHSADDKVLACRSQGHAWPKLKPGRPQRGVRPARQRDGSWQITFTCRDCGTDRTLTTLPAGTLGPERHYTYQYQAGYQAPPGSGVTRRDCLTELWTRSRDDLERSLPEEDKTP